MKVTKNTLEKAAEQKIIESRHIEPLFQFIQQQQTESTDSINEEPLKFIRSFGDIFITLGIILLSMSINMTELSGYYYFIPAAGFVVISEWLVRVRRLALPGIAILIAILFFVNKAIEFNHEDATLFGLAVLCITSLLFYLRYKMPFSLLPFTAGLVTIAITQIGLNMIEYPVIFAILGLIVFTAAMWFDSQDTERKSHLSDTAFWLHLLASPLIVHGLMLSMVMSEQSWIQSISMEIIIVAFFAGFLLLALFVDRRAMLVSTQLYMIYALTQILQNQISSGENIMIYVLMAIGLFVIFFGTYWYMARRLIFGFLSNTLISRYVPDLMIQDVK
jgi:hypothetical protein